MKPSITCHQYDTWSSAHATHTPDFVVYMFDVLPADELCVPNLTSYIGSAGANATREKETKSSSKSDYFKGALDARYRGGSYTKNHTRPQSVVIFTVSRNEALPGESKKAHQARVNAPGYKREERNLLGVLEYHLYNAAKANGIMLNNGEVPKCSDNEYSRMTTSEFFTAVDFCGNVPFIVYVARGDITMDEVRESQRKVAVRYAQSLLEQHNGNV